MLILSPSSTCPHPPQSERREISQHVLPVMKQVAYRPSSLLVLCMFKDQTGEKQMSSDFPLTLATHGISLPPLRDEKKELPKT